MGVDLKEQFSKEHPLNLKIKDTDLFLHGTSSKKYWIIQTTGFLLRGVADRNWSVSQTGICFEKYVARAHPKQGQYCGVSVADRIDHTIKMCCKVACENDDSSEAVVLQIKGRELRKLGCPIYADWNKPYWKVRDVEGNPIDVNYDAPYLSIIIIDCDIPLKYLEVVKRVPD
jgi:hypothetical protein